MEIQLGYVSTATAPMRREALLDILHQARTANAADGITGLLLYHNGHFVQALEGPEEAVRDLYDRIRRDPRHRDVATIFEQVIDRRDFPDWSMGFKALNGTEWLEFPGVDGGRDDLRAVVEKHGRAKALLMMMRERGIGRKQDLDTTA
jgi:hypothetical protein